MEGCPCKFPPNRGWRSKALQENGRWKPWLEKMLVKGEDNPFTSIVFEAHTFYVE